MIKGKVNEGDATASRDRRLAWLFGVTFLVAGIFAAVGIVAAYWTDSGITRNGLRATGHVTKKELLRVANGDSDYLLDYWFQLPNGERIATSRGVNQRLWSTLRQGDTFVVLYAADDPRRNFPLGGGFTSIGLTVFLLVLTSAFAVFGALLIHRAWRLNSRWKDGIGA